MTRFLAIYHSQDPHPDVRLPDTHQDTFSKTVLGFWLYLMTDCILFASLFATYAILHTSTFGGPSPRDLYSLSSSFTETMLLLFSSLACGFSMLSAKENKKNRTVIWLIVTFILGVSFIAFELHEFNQLIQEGNSWERSAFLSSFFALVGTHGLHVSVGLLWMAVMIMQILACGLTVDTFRRLVVFSLFWHFLDVIWIFIFSFVYLMGVI